VLLNFAADSSKESATGFCYAAPSAVGSSYSTIEQMAFEDTDASDVASDNRDRDGDRLYNRDMLNSIRDFEDKEARESADVAVVDKKA
jgi:hypothetical protein